MNQRTDGVKLFIILFLIHFLSKLRASQAAQWVSFGSSINYRDAKLVTETENPLESTSFPKDGNRASSVAIVCSQVCVSNASCQAFNFYPNNTHYICEYLLENFCNHRQRVALLAWPGATVWDKLSPGKTRACIDQQFGGQSNSSFCEIGRFGCKGTWPSCNSCFTNCRNSSMTGYFNYTLWPEGPTGVPVFTFCYWITTIIIQKRVDLTNGIVWPNYTMSLVDMGRLSSFAGYTKLRFTFFAYGGKIYNVTYGNFVINSKGTLMNMNCYPCSGPDDGINTGNTPLKRSLWVYANSTCGSFWLLNSTQGASSTMSCPGGGVGIFGNVNVSSADIKYKQTGIRWPQAARDNKTLYYAEIAMTVT